MRGWLPALPATAAVAPPSQTAQLNPSAPPALREHTQMPAATE